MSNADFPQSITRTMALETALKYLTGMTNDMTAEELGTAAHIAQAWISLAGALRTTTATPKTPQNKPVLQGPVQVEIIGSPLKIYGDDLGIYTAGIAKGRELAARAVLRKLQEAPPGHGQVEWDTEYYGAPQWLIDLAVQAAVDG